MNHVSPALRRIATIFALTIVSVSAYALIAVPPAGAATPRVLAIRFGPDLEVNPVTKDYVNHQLDEAEKHYDAAVIELDTPGGLSSSLRSIYQKELSLKIPVIVYVSPNGARAASAGVWIAKRATCSRCRPSRTSAPRRRSTRTAGTSAPTSGARW